MRLKLFIIVLLMSVALLYSVSAMEFTCNGRALAVIVTPEKADGDELEAAQTLQRYLKEISGVELPIKPETSQEIPGARVCLGRVAALPKDLTEKLQLDKKPMLSSPINDAYVIAARDASLYLCGHRTGGTIYAVYDLLEQLGCRWYFGCPAGTVIPKSSNLGFACEEQFKQPLFSYRIHYSWNHRSPETIEAERLWRRANRMSDKELSGFSGHNFASIWPKAKYPELFPEIEGKKKTHQVCISNPKTWQLGLDWALEQIAKNPDNELVSFSPNDGYGHCECPACLKIGNVADRNVFLANQIGKEFFKQHPDKMILIWAYAGGAQLPNMKIDGYAEDADKVIVNIYDFFTKIPIRDLLNSWRKVSHHLITTQNWYDFHPAWGVSADPFWKNMSADYRFMYENGITMLRSQTKADWAKCGYSRYLSAKLMWDPYCDVEALKRDFAKNMFPNASNEAYNLISLYEDCRRKISYKEFLSDALSLLSRMEQKIKTPEEELRWNFYASFICYGALVSGLGNVDAKQDPEKVKERQERFISFVKGMDKFGALETYQRLQACHVKILVAHAGMTGKEAWALVKEAEIEALDRQKLSSMIKKYQELFPERPLVYESLPF